MEPVREFEIADLRKILHGTWRPRQKYTGPPSLFHEQQDSVPRDALLHEKMGLKPGSRVLFFAGAAGDWAHGLAETGKVEVHYSDINRQTVDYVKKRFPKTKIASFSVADAMRWPKKLKYDRVVSFEPIPLTLTSLPITILRAIAHSEGATLAYGPFLEDAPTLRQFKVLYGAGIRHEKKRVTTTWSQGSRREGELIEMRHVDAPVGKHKLLAQLDLAVLAALAGKKGVSLSELARHPTVTRHEASKEDLLESLKRLSELSKMVLPEVRSKFSVSTD